MKNSDNAIVFKSFDFSVRVVKCYKHLIKQDKDLRSLYDQLMRAGTSIGANVAESQAAGSKTDFRNKLRISLKEAYEAEFWLKLFFVTEHLSEKEFNSLNKDCVEIIKLLTSIIKNIKIK
jgi:four helix bundle protein